MILSETSGHKIGKLDHLSAEEAEKNDFKCNFMRMMETFKEELKNSLKLMEKKKKNGRNK